MAWLLSALLSALPVSGAANPSGGTSGSGPVATHGGLLATGGAFAFELVVGPERLALYLTPLTPAAAPAAAARDLAPPAPAQAEQVTLLCAGQPALTLDPVADRFEAPNPWGVDRPLTIAAVVQQVGSAAAARFAFRPQAASSFHDHRAYHGGVVGMVGERHLELALAPVGEVRTTTRSRHPELAQSELQLYVTDAYRQPIPLPGLSATATLADGSAVRLTASAGSFVGRLARPRGPLDAHVEVRFPGEVEPVAMDFYLAPAAVQAGAGPAGVDPTRNGPIDIRVTSGGYSPDRIETRAGEPLTLRFLRTTDRTCGTQVIFPALGISRDLPLDTVIEVKLVAPRGELAFTCGMHMFRGSIVGQ